MILCINGFFGLANSPDIRKMMKDERFDNILLYAEKEKKK